MNHEPLNLKEIKKLIEECAKNYEIFGDALIESSFIGIKQRIKSAIDGLLTDIKQIEKYVDYIASHEYDMGFSDGVIDTCEKMREKIKKWFADVVEVVGNESSL